jgi:hypothetical protein
MEHRCSDVQYWLCLHFLSPTKIGEDTIAAVSKDLLPFSSGHLSDAAKYHLLFHEIWVGAPSELRVHIYGNFPQDGIRKTLADRLRDGPFHLKLVAVLAAPPP